MDSAAECGRIRTLQRYPSCGAQINAGTGDSRVLTVSEGACPPASRCQPTVDDVVGRRPRLLSPLNRPCVVGEWTVCSRRATGPGVRTRPTAERLCDGLGDPQLGVGGHRVVSKGQHQLPQLVAQFRGDRPSASSLMVWAWMSRSRLRVAASRGSVWACWWSWLTMAAIRITLPGFGTDGGSGSSSAV